MQFNNHYNIESVIFNELRLKIMNKSYDTGHFQWAL